MICDNQIFGAPLAGISDLPFRRVIRMFSPDAPLVTEMISCHSIVAAHKNCRRNFDRYEAEGNIGAQIFGADVNLMADAARILADNGARWIDINMGCPVPKVATRAGAGAHLMRDHGLAGRIISAVRRAVDIPVSVKTRLGWDDDHRDWADLAKIAADCGASWLTLHGRTRAQLYIGPAKLPDVHDCPIPVIANGDIRTPDDVAAARELGYAGTMVGRALMGRPWALRYAGGGADVPSDLGAVVCKHLEYAVEYYGEHAAVPMFRKHAAWYSAGCPGANAFRIRVNSITDAKQMRDAICEFWGCVDAA